MQPDLERLEALARAATRFVEWFDWYESLYCPTDDEPIEDDDALVFGWHGPDKTDGLTFGDFRKLREALKNAGWSYDLKN